MKQVVWFNSPAKRWRQAMPVGNGKIGAMIFGGIKKETLSLNDETLWSGYPKNQNNPQSKEYLDKARRLVFDGKNTEADTLCMEKLCGAYSESYLPLGDIIISFKNAKSNGYRRSLDLLTAVHTVSCGEVTREAFASNPDNVLVYKITSQTPISIKITAKSKLKGYGVYTSDCLNLVGNAPDYVAPNYLRTKLFPVKYDEHKGMSFCARVEAVSDGKVSYGKKSVKINAAKNIILYVATATGFTEFNRMPETDRNVPLKECRDTLKKVLNLSYEEIKAKHIKDFSEIFSKQDISLDKETKLSTEELVSNAKNGKVDLALIDLFYHFGKYLIISGSRRGGQALNLQGIWNRSVRPPWSSNYTTNINTEMNYWGATKSGLSDCIEPYITLVYNIMKNGKSTAKINYGCSGFACNHNVDIWCKTAPVQGTPNYMYAPLCGAWLSNELYSHYKNGDLAEYKDKIEEIARETAAFCNDYLVLNDGFYVTAPSASPEASFVSGKAKASLDYASAFEMGIVKQAFSNFLDFGGDTMLASDIKEKIPLLYPYKKGSTGLSEWHDDRPISEKGHRHFSPLYGFYPGNIIKYFKNPEQTSWVKELFNYRTDNSTQFIGWSAAWAICIAGRLHDGEKAQSIIESMLGHSVFYNLFAVHPPFLFQIDGNLGFVAGINEMLLYEENGKFELVPAVPKEWKNGSVKDMVVNGNKISFTWKDGVVTEITAEKPAEIIKTANIKNDCLITNIKFCEVIG